MAVTISLYDHTARRFANGSNAVGDTYKLMLCTAATFNAANTTLANITKTEVANGNGYTTGGETLSAVTVATTDTNGARFDANDVLWGASGGSIAAAFAILYNDTDAGDPPVAFIDFDGTQTVSDGFDFLVTWDSDGIIKWTVPV